MVHPEKTRDPPRKPVNLLKPEPYSKLIRELDDIRMNPKRIYECRSTEYSSVVDTSEGLLCLHQIDGSSFSSNVDYSTELFYEAVGPCVIYHFAHKGSGF